MCGICGIVNFDQKSVEKQQIQTMMSRMKKRGPDDEGIFTENNIGLGHVRLSIIDLSIAGHQPMFSSNEKYCMVYNGEIYNYIEIKEELSSKFEFRSKTDTEVLLCAYQEWGEGCLDRLNGMFAFAIYDRNKKEIFIARDRYGIKPFYYYYDHNQIIFASEISPILTQLKFKLESNERVVFDYLVFNRTDQSEDTFFNDIKKLQPGHIMKIKSNKIEINRWYCLTEKLCNPIQNPEEFRTLFSSSVGIRLRSDVPVGVCLSGGLDSSSIVSVLLNDYKKYDLKTFSIIYGKDIETDESKYINLFKKKIKNMFFTVPSAEIFLNDISSFVEAHGEPVPTAGPYAQFRVMKLAKGKAVVLLDGQGGDEILGGYHYFFGYYYKELLRRLKFIKLLSENLYYLKNHSSLMALKTFFFFLLPNNLKVTAKSYSKKYIKRGFFLRYRNNSLISNVLYESKGLIEALLNHFEMKLEHLLKWEDRNSMYFSLESRVPFLDHRLVERTLASPPEYIISKGTNKAILRKAMKDYLPGEIRIRRDKIGFSPPQDIWFRHPKVKEYVEDLLNSQYFRTNNFIDFEEALRLYKRHLDKKVNAGNDIWKWINLAEWYEHFNLFL